MLSIELLRGDCLRILEALPNHSVDLILADLPYGTTQNKWDSLLPLDALWRLYWRVAKIDAPVVLTAQCPFDKILGMSCLRYLKYEWFWIKSTATGFLNAKKSPLKNVENVLVFYRKQPTYNPQMRAGYAKYKVSHGVRSSNYGAMLEGHISQSSGERYPWSTLTFQSQHGEHPTQKPVELMEYMIRTYTNPGDTVLDNVMGSGTTGLAAVRLGRSFIGIEKDVSYFNTARSRLEREISRRALVESRPSFVVRTPRASILRPS